MAEPVQRIRDAKRYTKPQQIVSNDEWTDIENRAIFSKTFLDEKNPLYQSMLFSLKEAEGMILENRIREVQEEHTISDTFKKIFVTPKKLQDDEVIGQIKFIRQFIAEAKTWIDFKEELEKKEAEGIIRIDRSKV